MAKTHAGHTHFSPIVQALHQAQNETSAEIRVHLSKKIFEPDPFKRAMGLFRHYGMFRTTHRNAVLLYVNLRKRRFAIVGDEGAHRALGQRFWEELALELKRGFASTHPERAIAHTVLKLGTALSTHFPLEHP